MGITCVCVRVCPCVPACVDLFAFLWACNQNRLVNKMRPPQLMPPPRPATTPLAWQHQTPLLRNPKMSHVWVFERHPNKQRPNIRRVPTRSCIFAKGTNRTCVDNQFDFLKQMTRQTREVQKHLHMDHVAPTHKYTQKVATRNSGPGILAA